MPKIRRHPLPLGIADALAGVRFLRSVPGFLRRPVHLGEARSALRHRLATREVDFLNLVQRAIYRQPESPYLRLLSVAGCEYGDLEQLVEQNGLEGALQRLLARGVYLTVDELKGRREAVRGSASVRVDPIGLLNPLSNQHFLIQTSGSRGERSAVLIDLESLRVQAGNHRLVLQARGGSDWQYAHWGVPGSSVLGRLLGFSLIGARPRRWFSQIDPRLLDLHPRYRWSARAARWGSLLAGLAIPEAHYVPLDDPRPILCWMRETLRSGHTPNLGTFPSSALRLCQTALDSGYDLHGAQLTLHGEPFTPARMSAIRRAGAEPYPLYGSSETGILGYGCLRPAAPDDVHLSVDMHAVIQSPEGSSKPDLPASSLLLSSLRGTARMILLNASLGDQAEWEADACGCPLQDLGWVQRVHTIRSYEKLTAGGMALLDSEVIQVLEEVLPSQFGGAPTDYQLVEEQAERGEPRLRLLVHPRIGPLDGAIVADAFLTAIGTGSPTNHVMETHWRQAGLLEVERAAPRVTESGKLVHLHQERHTRARAGVTT